MYGKTFVLAACLSAANAAGLGLTRAEALFPTNDNVRALTENSGIRCRCPVDCTFTDWKLGSCSVTCGTGVQEFTREKVPAEYGGEDCDDSELLTKTNGTECNKEACPAPAAECVCNRLPGSIAETGDVCTSIVEQHEGKIDKDSEGRYIVCKSCGPSSYEDPVRGLVYPSVQKSPSDAGFGRPYKSCVECTEGHGRESWDCPSAAPYCCNGICTAKVGGVCPSEKFVERSD